jgi:hypothetical protein
LTDPGGTDSVTFPTTIFSIDEIKAIMRLSPRLRISNSYPVINSIDMCVTTEPDYHGCGTKAAREEWFKHNANVSIKKMEAALNDLDNIPRAEELKQIIQYERALQKFYLEIERVRLQFKLTGDLSLLEEPIQGIDPRILCSDSLIKVKHATSQNDANEIVRMDWYNCMNKQIYAKVGMYPLEAWNAFLKNESIEEIYTSTDE